MRKKQNAGVTIITSTIRSSYLDHVFKNYARQSWPNKELIIILNKNDLKLVDYKKHAKKHPNVRVFRKSERYSLGECLNFAVKRAKYPYIAKFDDDDYYGPNYLTESMYMFKSSKADIVGKKSFFFYFPHHKILLQRRIFVQPFSRCYKISGATIMFHKRVSKRVKFARMAQGTDVRFIKVCLKEGYKMYATSSYNFVAIRRANHQSHTWKISDKKLLSESNTRMFRTTRYKKIVNKSLDKLKKIGNMPKKTKHILFLSKKSLNA